MSKQMSAEAAVAMIQDGDTLSTSGFVQTGNPDVLSSALEKRFLETGSPCNLTLLYAAGQGDGKDMAVNHLGHEKLLKRVIAGHWNLAPKLGKLAVEEKIEAYNLPQGTLSQMFRDTAAGKVGTLTHVGLKTFVDPRLDGGKLNTRTKEDIVEVVTLGGRELLFYKSFPINVCFIRATTADEKGNITMEKEGVTLDATAMAQATHNSGGKVIVQVERIVKNGTLDPKLVKIPHSYVDAIVMVRPEENRPENDSVLSPCSYGEVSIPLDSLPVSKLDERKIIGRRAAMELKRDTMVNLGVGVPEMVASVAAEEGIGEYMTLTVESGPVGGVPCGGKLFGLSLDPDCILDQAYQFDFYDGGGLDLAYLGLAECDEKGNINVSKLGSRVTGCGGFINISQNAKRVFFCGSFTAKGLKIATGDGKLTILQEGASKKFVKQVGHVTFSGENAVATGQPVLYITERAVFELRADGLHLIEVAPGIDIEKDILAHMDFAPKMDTTPKLMDARIFMDAPMGLK